MGVYLAKPPCPVLQPNRLPAGCKAYYALTERSGPTVRDSSGNGYHGSFTQAPAWQTGPYGPQCGGLSTANYISLPAMPQILYGSAYPCWAAIGFINTSTTGQVIFSQASSTNAQTQLQIQINNGGAGRVLCNIRFDNGAALASLAVSALPLNDGAPHVVQLLSRSASDHRLIFDGAEIANNSTALTGAFTADFFSLGLYRSGFSSAAPLLGSIFAAAFGVGSMPDSATLAKDWLSGRFSAVRPSRVASAMFATIVSPVFRRKLSPGRIGSRSVA